MNGHVAAGYAVILGGRDELLRQEKKKFTSSAPYEHTFTKMENGCFVQSKLHISWFALSIAQTV